MGVSSVGAAGTPNPQTLACGGVGVGGRGGGSRVMDMRGEESGGFPLYPAGQVLPPARALPCAPSPPLSSPAGCPIGRRGTGEQRRWAAIGCACEHATRLGN